MKQLVDDNYSKNIYMYILWYANGCRWPFYIFAFGQRDYTFGFKKYASWHRSLYSFDFQFVERY